MASKNKKRGKSKRFAPSCFLSDNHNHPDLILNQVNINVSAVDTDSSFESDVEIMNSNRRTGYAQVIR